MSAETHHHHFEMVVGGMACRCGETITAAGRSRRDMSPVRPSVPPAPVPWHAQEVAQLVDEMLVALDGYRAAKRLFVERTAYYERKHGQTAEAEFAARDDYQRKKAIVDCEWYRGEILAASAALQALRAVYRGGL